jgi:serine/threonine protein kinase
MLNLQPNTTLQGGKYRIERLLGQGGFGITYLAVQTSLQRQVAIKEFFMKDFCSRDEATHMMSTPSTGSSKLVEQYRKKFIKEARNLARLNHPNIISVIDVFEENGTVYYVMPYLAGGSLQDYVKDNGTLSETLAMKYIKQIAGALKYMHEEQHICHYDVKPANILLGNKGNAVLIDFGISKNYDASGHETTTTPIGMSEGYAPIEQYLQNVEEFSPISDVYALGATLYFLLHGKRPVSAVHRASGAELMISEQLSQEIKGLIIDSMKVSKRDRANSVDVFLKEVSFSDQSTNSNVESVVKDEETVIASNEEDDVPFEILLKRAEAGDAEAQNELGDRYYYGNKVEMNRKLAFKWYMMAAKQGNPKAQFNVGWCYAKGKGTDVDNEKAFEWFNKSAEQGNVDAQHYLKKLGKSKNRHGNDHQTSLSLKGTNGWYKAVAFCVIFIPFIIFWAYNIFNIISFLGSIFVPSLTIFIFWWLLPEIGLALWYPLRGVLCYFINRNKTRVSLHDVIVTEFREDERNWRNWIPLMIVNVIILLICVLFL